MPKGIDEDWAKADPWSAKAQGYTFIIGYVSQDDTGKNLSQYNVDVAHEAGMDVGIVYEFNPRSALGGGAQAAVDAEVAISHAIALGVPPGVCLYAAVDWDVQPDEMPAVRGYTSMWLMMVRSHGWRGGVYAGYRVCADSTIRSHTDFRWQTYAWSNGLWAPDLALRQIHNGVSVGGATVDQDESEVVDWGQWSPEGSGTMSTFVEDAVYAICVGNLSVNGPNGTPIGVGPAQWETARKLWQADKDAQFTRIEASLSTITAALSTVATAVANLGAEGGGLTPQESDDLHTVADALRKFAS